MRRRRVEVPPAFAPLLAPRRYKGAFGGRGGAKSHFFATQLVLLAVSRSIRWVCIREVQRSIRESVRQLIADKVESLGLSSRFRVLEHEVRGVNGSLIVFKGMNDFTAANLKSLEGYDGAWVEEAQDLSARSLRLLRPTIRKAGSEMWFSWNPRHEDDPVDRLFRAEASPDRVAVQVSWRDNPWLSREVRDEIARDYAADAEIAEHVWGGGYESVSEAAYYARLIAQAERDGRLGGVEHDRRYDVDTSWDIGVNDYTAVWFTQLINGAVHVIDYYEVSGQGPAETLADALPEIVTSGAELLEAVRRLARPAPYRYGRHFFPHDLDAREWGAGGRSRYETVTRLGMRNVRVGVQDRDAERVNAVRALLPLCRFARTPRVTLGLSRLRRFARKFNRALGVFQGVLHDENSHGADAFGELAVNCPLLAPRERSRRAESPSVGAASLRPEVPHGFVAMPRREKRRGRREVAR